MLRPIQDIIVFDTEYTPQRGAVPESICLAAQSVTTGQTWAWWRDQLATRPALPFVPDGILLVAFSAFGDTLVWQACEWPVVRFIDLALELTRLQNVDRAKGSTPHWWSLREALAHYGLPVPESRHKREMQELCARGGPEVEAHRDAILQYCQEDVAHTVALWRAMADEILVLSRRRQAVYRGYALQAEAAWFRRGIPWDAELYHELECYWEPMKTALVDEINPRFHVYTPARTFSHAAFNSWLAAQQIAWPTDEDRADQRQAQHLEGHGAHRAGGEAPRRSLHDVERVQDVEGPGRAGWSRPDGSAGLRHEDGPQHRIDGGIPVQPRPVAPPAPPADAWHRLGRPVTTPPRSSRSPRPSRRIR